ncbi:MAG TPA: hypothetical protein VI564_01115 [Candidatus Nanoarchaeia archaeon]|nr:hypothetical protein [Candidatus Nanoarchaeia archaeon]
MKRDCMHCEFEAQRNESLRHHMLCRKCDFAVSPSRTMLFFVDSV